MSKRPHYLLDTNVLSETRKKRPEVRVLRFLEGAEPSALYLSVLTLGEFRKGIAFKRRTDAVGADRLAAWVDGLESGFSERILSVDVEIARLWGEFCAERSRPVIDTLLAATAIRHELTLVTRNDSDMRGLPVKILNPWESGT